MDERRLNTKEVLEAGIVNRPAPETDVPLDAERFEPLDEDYEFLGADAVEEALEEGKVIKVRGYYGIPYAWKKGEGEYRCLLLQYRRITESETFETAGAAALWFEEMYYQVEG